MGRPSSIILVGPMGSGKTAVGRALAKILGRDFYDTDRHVEERTGVDIAFIFEKEGEAGFRRRETDAIQHFASKSDIVLATGGGAVVEEVNRLSLSATGLVVYLKASPEQLYERTRASKNRPMLDTDNLKARITELLDERGPLYESIADLTVDTNGRRVAQVARDIAEKLDQDGMLVAR